MALVTSPLVIDEVVRRRRERLKKSPRGVWAGLGSAYQMKGEVDVDVGGIGRGAGGIRELTRSKKRGGGGRGEGGEATRKAERLIELFRQSRVKMLQTSHEAIREREREREKEKEREMQRRETRSARPTTREEDGEGGGGGGGGGPSSGGREGGGGGGTVEGFHSARWCGESIGLHRPMASVVG